MNWADALPPSRTAAIARISRVDPAGYARTRNDIEGAVTGLSPYLTHGLLTLPEVLTELLRREPLAVNHKLVFELGWREFFRHVWSYEGDGILQSLQKGPLPEAAYAPVLPLDIRQANTGLPVIDEAVRSLYATGTLHNHARMWLASYVVHSRQVHWRAGADWLLAHLLDGDVVSNHLSWQWVAGTFSHKPYLFNADNVAKFAPPQWHSPRSVIDLSYDALDQLARTVKTSSQMISSDRSANTAMTAEPLLLASPPPDLELHAPSAQAIARLKGREVWLMHPWALRAPPTDLAKDAVVIGVYLSDYHTTWHWPEMRWRWVDTAMAAFTDDRWLVNAADLSTALAGVARVRSVSDPHIMRWLKSIAHLDVAPTLFPLVDRRCTSFSQWWTRTTRGLHKAEDLL